MSLNKGFAEIEVINRLLEENTARDIAAGTGISLSAVRKLKSGERSVEKLNLADAIKLTEFAVRIGRKTVIEVYNNK